jgi:uncharacterized protein (DUF433 family)
VSWEDRIVIDPAILVGKHIIKGTRISVELIIDLLARGWTHEQIIGQHGHLTTDDIRACLTYASTHAVVARPE